MKAGFVCLSSGSRSCSFSNDHKRPRAGVALVVHWQAHDSVASHLQLQQSAAKEAKQNGAGRQLRPFDAQLQVGDRRGIGLYDARFHSTSWYPPQHLPPS